jgi:hypothetical protein
MRRLIAVVVIALLAVASARAEDAVTCDSPYRPRNATDADLIRRYCALSKLSGEASRKAIQAWNPEHEAESNRCITALAEVVRERFRRNLVIAGRPLCGEEP